MESQGVLFKHGCVKILDTKKTGKIAMSLIMVGKCTIHSKSIDILKSSNKIYMKEEVNEENYRIKYCVERIYATTVLQNEELMTEKFIFQVY